MRKKGTCQMIKRFTVKNFTIAVSGATVLAIMPMAAVKGNLNSYRTYHLHLDEGTEFALNTNNAFRRVNGQPRMSISEHDINDQDQQFQIVDVEYDEVAFGLRQRSTGKCLNAHNPRSENGAEVNVWGCDSTDPDQMFVRRPLQGDTFQIQTRDGKFCIDSPTREHYGRVHLWECLQPTDDDYLNQRWTEMEVE